MFESINKDKLIKAGLITLLIGILALLFYITRRGIGKTTPAPYVSTEEQEAVSDFGPPPLRGDLDFSEGVKTLHKDYPWYSKLPVDTEEYVIVFDLERKEFRIRLKVPETSSQDIKDTTLNKAVSKLREITGQDFNNYTYYVLYQKEN
ncbi:hypothetical protein ACFLZ4_01280 [Patescibacteria group bacterium]